MEGMPHPVEADLAIGLDDARRILSGTPFVRWWQLDVTELGAGWASVALPWRDEFVRPGGVLHGSCYEVVADVAMWLAIMTVTGEEPMAVTIEMKTSFLRGATTGITSRAEVLKLGRRVAFGVATTTDALGEPVAHSTLSYVRSPATP
jgi:uncharacterized protein (TIGR00369 family)